MCSFCIVVEPQNVSYCCQNKRTQEVSDTIMRFHPNLKFVDWLSQRSPMSNFLEIRHLGAEVIHAARRTDGHDARNRRFSRLKVGTQ
jgi:hypothetical protein